MGLVRTIRAAPRPPARSTGTVARRGTPRSPARRARPPGPGTARPPGRPPARASRSASPTWGSASARPPPRSPPRPLARAPAVDPRPHAAVGVKPQQFREHRNVASGSGANRQAQRTPAQHPTNPISRRADQPRRPVPRATPATAVDRLRWGQQSPVVPLPGRDRRVTSRSWVSSVARLRTIDVINTARLGPVFAWG
jgi:hypothetical protein